MSRRSKEEVHAIVSALGVAGTFLGTLVREGKRQGVSDEVLYRLGNPEEPIINRLVSVLVEESGLFRFVVDYSRTRKEMVEAGNYDCVDDYIVEADPVFEVEGYGEGEVELVAKLFHFDRRICSEEAIREMEKEVYRRGNHAELLKLGEKHPDLQRKFSIVALGSVWRSPRGLRYVPSLWCRVDERRLHLYWFEGGWDSHYRFLAVRK